MKLPKPPSFSLKGKRAFVTGATSGIGLGCAVALANAGAKVVLSGRREDILENLVKEFKKNTWDAVKQPLDVNDVEKLKAIISDIGPFDIGVYSSGIARHSPSLQTTKNDYDNVMDVNLRGAYFFAQALGAGLINSGKPGSIIFISSQMSKIGGFDRAVYSGSKHALEGFQKSMATEWGPMGIRINSVCPTFIRTPLTEKTFSNPERVNWIKEKIKIGRVGQVEDVMGAVLFLASDASSLITGTSIVVDGGWTAA